MSERRHLMKILLWSFMLVQTGRFVNCAVEKGNSSKAATNSRDDLIIPSLGVYDRWFFSVMKKIQELGELEPQLVEAQKNPKTIKVNKDGGGDFVTITEALDSIKEDNKNRVIIQIDGGVYEEKVTIKKNKPFVTLVGNFVDMPVIFYEKILKIPTNDTATLTVESDYFQAGNLIIKNNVTSDGDGEFRGKALSVEGDAAYLENCTFEAFTYTINDVKGRHFFYDCAIWGSERLVFGAGRSIYLTTDFNLTDAYLNGMVAVNQRENYKDDKGGGFVFVLCHLRSSLDEPKSVYLSTPDAAGSRVIFAYTKVTPSEVIDPRRFYAVDWGDHADTAFLAEYKDEEDMDEPADLKSMTPEAHHLSDAEAKKFLSLDFIEATKWVVPIPSYGYRDDHVLHPL